MANDDFDGTQDYNEGAARERARLATIGDVIVVPKGTANPYRNGVQGDERIDALRRFKAGQPLPAYDVWFAPWAGPARRITRADVDWETSGL